MRHKGVVSEQARVPSRVEIGSKIFCLELQTFFQSPGHSPAEVHRASGRCPTHQMGAALLQTNLRWFSQSRKSTRATWNTWIGICVASLFLLPTGSAARSVVLAPLLEETVFRLGVHDALSMRLPSHAARFASVLTAVAFAGLHLRFASDYRAGLLALATAVPAWWIGVLYERDRRLGPCVAWHAAFNFAWLDGLQSLFPNLGAP